MTKHYNLNEDKLPLKLLVIFSSKIRTNIDAIVHYNQNNTEGLSQWYDYLDGIRNYISNPVIAYDYTNRYSKFPNGAIYNRDFDYNAAYVVKTNNTTNQPYVYIFKMNLNTEEYGLEIPPTLDENKQRNNMSKTKRTINLNEFDLRKMVTETVKLVLMESKNRRLDETISRTLRRTLREHLKNN